MSYRLIALLSLEGQAHCRYCRYWRSADCVGGRCSQIAVPMGSLGSFKGRLVKSEVDVRP